MKQKTIIQLSVVMLFLMGSCLTTVAQAKKAMIIEVTTFETNPGVDQQVFSERDREIQKDYTAKQAGFIKRLSGMNDQGEWVVIVHWQTMQDAEASMNLFMTDKSVADYAAMINGSTMRMNRYTSNTPKKKGKGNGKSKNKKE